MKNAPFFALYSCFSFAPPVLAVHFHLKSLFSFVPFSLPVLIPPLLFSPLFWTYSSLYLLTFSHFHSPSFWRTNLQYSSFRSDPFHQSETANYLPFYDFHYFTTHTVFYYWAVGSQHWHISTHTHTHLWMHINTGNKQYTQSRRQRNTHSYMHT